MLLTIYKDNKRRWRWSLNARNGRVIHAATQGYIRRREVRKNLRQVVGVTLPIRFDRPEIERYELRMQLGLRFLVKVAVPL